MFQGTSRPLSAAFINACCWLRDRKPRRIAIIAPALAVALSAAAFGEPFPSSHSSMRDFFCAIVGEWIGTCKQTTNAEQAETKYFHGVVEQLDPDTFESKFQYYRLDKETGDALSAGETTVITTLQPDGAATSKMTGKGEVLINNKPKNQEHELTEVVKCVDDGRLEGEGSGVIRVSGMPLGLGKKGKVRKAESSWSLDNGVLTIYQSLNVRFSILFLKKSFDVTAHYTATRGSDVASLMSEPTRVSSRSPLGAVSGS